VVCHIFQIFNLHLNKQKYKSKQKKDFTSRNIKIKLNRKEERKERKSSNLATTCKRARRGK
jgi:hypothetical protein